MGVCCEDLGENWLCFNGTALHCVTIWCHSTISSWNNVNQVPWYMWIAYDKSVVNPLLMYRNYHGLACFAEWSRDTLKWNAGPLWSAVSVIMLWYGWMSVNKEWTIHTVETPFSMIPYDTKLDEHQIITALKPQQTPLFLHISTRGASDIYKHQNSRTWS